MCSVPPGTGTSAIFQARLHAFMPPSRESACIPCAWSSSAAIRLVLPATQTVTTGISPGNSTLASALRSLALSASYASMCMLPGMDHSTRSCIGRISSTVTGTASSSHVLTVSTSIVFISMLLFRSRLQYAPIVQISVYNAINLCHASFSYLPHGLPQGEHTLVSQMVVDVNTFAAHLDKLGGTQYLQML